MDVHHRYYKPYKTKELASANSYPMRREGLEPSRPKAVTGSLVLRVCQFRHPRVDYFTSISTFGMLVNTFFNFFHLWDSNVIGVRLH